MPQDLLQEESCLRSKEERNYEIYDREMLGFIRALEDWRHFLEGISFEVITDHKNIEWWTTMRDLNSVTDAVFYRL